MNFPSITADRASQRQDRGPILRVGSDDAVWALTPWSGASAQRFSRFVQDLPSHLEHIQPALGFLSSAIAYDCVLSESDLIAMAEMASSTSAPNIGIRATWKSDRGGYLHDEVRCLSWRTRLIARRLPPKVNWSVAVDELRGFLQKNYPELNTSDHALALGEVFTDAKTWWYLHLPQCLFSHVQGAVRMPVLDEMVHRRLHSKQPHPTNPPTSADVVLDEAHDQALNNLLGIPSNVNPTHPKNTISHIQSIFSVGNNQAGLRLATYLNARELRDKLTLAIELMRSEGWIASVLLSWAIHLLSVGSVRKTNPAISTLAAYMAAMLEQLADSLRSLKYPPALYSQDDWLRLFETLQQHPPSGQFGAALASLHHWAVRTYGCDPMPDVMFQTVEATRVHANLIWSHEQQRALDFAVNVSSDERVCQQVLIMLALGSGGLFRVGDLPGLTVLDLEIGDGVLRVHINPGRGIHGGKSRAARRIVRIHEPALIALITHWRDRRKLESESCPSGDVLLFGDPHAPHKLYRVGYCIRLVNDILRCSTGDDRVSFHTLRHSGATARAYTLLTQSPTSSAISPLDELCHEMGHATRDTLWSVYFHLSDYALRDAIDRIPSVAEVSADEAAFWLKLTPAALRQRACRAASESLPPSSLYRRWVQELADDAPSAMWRPEVQKALQQPAPVTARAPTPKDLKWVRQALAAIAQGCTSESTCLRQSCETEDLLALCLAIQTALGSLTTVGRDRSAPLLLATANIDHALQWARQQLTRQHWSFEPESERHLQDLAIFLERNARTPACAQAALAWAKMRRHNVLSMDDSIATQAMLHLLRGASFPADLLVARVQDEASSDSEGLRRTESAMDDLRSTVLLGIGTSVRIERVKPRRGHPDRYLLVARSRLTPGSIASSAAVRMREFHELFFALCVYQSLQRDKVTL